MTFTECVLHCFDNTELVSNFNRLWSCSLGTDRRSTIERMIDQTAQYDGRSVNEDDAKLFIAFVWEYVWTRLPPETFDEPGV